MIGLLRKAIIGFSVSGVLASDYVSTEEEVFPHFSIKNNPISANVCALFPEKEETPYLAELRKGEDFFYLSLHHDAIPCYERVLEVLTAEGSENVTQRVSVRLCQSYLLLGDYAGAEGVLANKEASKKDILSPEMGYLLYLKAFTMRHLKRYDEAIKLLSTTLSGIKTLPRFLYDLFTLEEGISHYKNGAHGHAKKVLAGLAHAADEETVSNLAHLYLARTEMAGRNYRSTKKLLSSLYNGMKEGSPLQHEVLYLMGVAAQHLDEYREAALHFEKILAEGSIGQEKWDLKVFEALCDTYLKILEPSIEKSEDAREYVAKADKLFATYYERFPSEKSTLALGYFHLVKGKFLHDPLSIQKANEILSENTRLRSKDSQAYALMLRAQASTSYAERASLFEKLTEIADRDDTYHSYGWYFRGLNDYNEAHVLLKNNKMDESKKGFEKAAASLDKAFSLLMAMNDPLAGETLLLLAEALHLEDDSDKLSHTFQGLLSYLENNGDQVDSSEEPCQYYYDTALVALHLYAREKKDPYFKCAQALLQQAHTLYPESKLADAAHYLFAVSHFIRGSYYQAEAAFLHVFKEFPQSPLAGEALYWCGRAAKEQGKPSKEIRALYSRVYEEYPSSKYASDAYFQCYSYQEYLQGDRTAIKHLHNFKGSCPESTYLLHAHFLLGLDCKRDRKTPEGKWLSKKTLTKAIDHFYNVELAYDNFAAAGRIPESQKALYQLIRHRATLERALANMLIADESQGAKRQIYLEYAESVFNNIIDSVCQHGHSAASLLGKSDAIAAIYEESAYGLAQAHRKSGKVEKAKNVLLAMIDSYREAKVTKGYFLSRGLYELGTMALDEGENHYALDYFLRSEDAGKFHVLSTDQKLDLWIQMSECHRRIGSLNKAMELLSRVINEDAISGQRLKAMYLRASIYEQQNRHELARKQLEATAKKGGMWAKKAKDKLAKDYAYDNFLR